LPDFIYDPKVCHFKTWLLNLTRWRIQDQIRRRRPSPLHSSLKAGYIGSQLRPYSDASLGGTTTTNEEIPDPAVDEFGVEWDAAWQKNQLEQALAAIQPGVDPRQFQIFDLYVIKGWPAKEVATTLGVNIGRVYLIKHRLSGLLKKEIERLERLAAPKN
jgi:RNA polymerase sigma-70 factor (ECF subfamily)